MSEIAKLVPNKTTLEASNDKQEQQKPKRASGHVQSLSRALSVLNELSRHNQGLTLSELAQKVTLPTSTAHRLLTTLQNERYVRFAKEHNLWFVGVQAFEVGAAFVRSRDIVCIARPFMRRLMEESGETVNIAVHDNGEVVFLEQVESRNMMRAIAGPGGRVPAHSSGIGKAFLASMSQAEAMAVIKRQGPECSVSKSLISRERFMAELKRIRKRGYAVDDEDFAVGLRCVAGMIYNEHGEPIAGISISGPTARITDDRIPELGRRVWERGLDITKEMGGRVPDPDGDGAIRLAPKSLS